MADQQKYTVDQVATAARELREAAGAGEEFFTGAEVIRMLSKEITLLRERGFSEERIADLLTGFDIEASADDVAHSAPAPIL
jgi:hypothetical protein